MIVTIHHGWSQLPNPSLPPAIHSFYLTTVRVVSEAGGEVREGTTSNWNTKLYESSWHNVCAQWSSQSIRCMLWDYAYCIANPTSVIKPTFPSRLIFFSNSRECVFYNWKEQESCWEGEKWESWNVYSQLHFPCEKYLCAKGRFSPVAKKDSETWSSRQGGDGLIRKPEFFSFFKMRIWKQWGSDVGPITALLTDSLLQYLIKTETACLS